MLASDPNVPTFACMHACMLASDPNVPTFACMHACMHARVRSQRTASLAVSHHGPVVRVNVTTVPGAIVDDTVTHHCPVVRVRAGAVAQGLAGWLTNPFDLLKTRVQSGVAANVGVAFRSVLLEGGPAALMRGAGMRVFWIAPQGCVYFPAYELTLRCLACMCSPRRPVPSPQVRLLPRVRAHATLPRTIAVG
jgi:hypothetical protein